MNTKFLLIAMAFAAGIFFASCEKDNAARPVITILELGEGDTHGNDHTAKIGGELHIEADIVAEGKIDKIQVRIHPEGEHDAAVTVQEWELDTTYTKFSGLKNTIFHEHLDIANTAIAGDYHFDFTVTDQEGNQSSAEAELKILAK